MATRYYPITTNVGACDDTPGDPYDMSKTQGSPTTVTKSLTGISISTKIFHWDVDVYADGPTTGDHSISISINSITNGSVKFILVSVDGSDCTLKDASGFSSNYTTSGVKTFILTMSSWDSTATILRLICYGIQTATMGTRSVTLDVQHASTYTDAPWTVSAGGIIIPNRMGLVGVGV